MGIRFSLVHKQPPKLLLSQCVVDLAKPYCSSMGACIDNHFTVLT